MAQHQPGNGAPARPWYGPVVRDALITAWRTVNYICGKRFVPFLPELLPILERHGHLSLSEQTRQQLYQMSAATADRVLRQFRVANRPQGKSTTKAGQLLKHRIPVRTFADWKDNKPGFMEADLVAHCGVHVDGPFLHTLVLTDVSTGWTECQALLHRTEADVIQALQTVRQLLPFPLLGLDTDNGSEFINYGLLAYCEKESIQFTRGRPRRKNDQCFVEQKNGSIVRQLVGYDRYEGSLAYRQLAELYRVVRLFVNFFQPSMKLTRKSRHGSKVKKQYDIAQTPYQRLSKSKTLDKNMREHMKVLYQQLDPVDLLRQLEKLQDAFWRHANELRPNQVPVDVLRAAPVSGHSNSHGPVPSEDSLLLAELQLPVLEQRLKRRYRRTKKSGTPHTWRTRTDPFDGVWKEAQSWLESEPSYNRKWCLRD